MKGLLGHEYQRQVLQGGGRFFESSFVLRTARDGASLISGSSLFHSEVQLG